MNASRTVLRDTPNASPIASSGNRDPGGNSPSLICSRSASATRAAVGCTTTRVRAPDSAASAPVTDSPDFMTTRGVYYFVILGLFHNPPIGRSSLFQPRGRESP